MRMQAGSLASLSGLRIGIAMSYDVGHRQGLDPTLMSLWCRPAATAPTQPLAQEPPYALGLALKSQKKQNRLSFLVLELTLTPLSFLAPYLSTGRWPAFDATTYAWRRTKTTNK